MNICSEGPFTPFPPWIYVCSSIQRSLIRNDLDLGKLLPNQIFRKSSKLENKWILFADDGFMLQKKGLAQSAKILLVPPKCGLFTVAPCKVIALNLFCFIFVIISSLISFISLSIVVAFLDLKDNSDKFFFTFHYRL